MNRIALVTGASRGLGATLAELMAAEGYDLIITARAAEALEAKADELTKLSVRVRAVAGDVADPYHRRRLVQEAQQWGGLDVLINNASDLGTTPLSPLASYALSELEHVLQVNLIAPVALVQLALPLLKAHRGIVVNISSDAAIGGYPGWGAYGASKAALDLVSLTLANELAGEGVTVVSVDPGDMRTVMHQAAYPDQDISDLPPPDVTLPFWVWLLGQDHQMVHGRRFRAQEERWEVPGVNRAELEFVRPSELQANAPPERRGLARDGVRLMVSTPRGHIHARFYDLAEFLRPGDLLVVNRSATLPATLPAEGRLGSFSVNLSTRYGGRVWLVEPRWGPAQPGPLPLRRGEALSIGGVAVHVVAPYPALPRLWFIRAESSLELAMSRVGKPIRYGYVGEEYPLEMFQTLFACVPGSAEMPSAGRPFTAAVLDRLADRGVELAEVVLHAGVSSLELDAGPVESQSVFPEPFWVFEAAAEAVNRLATRVGASSPWAPPSSGR
jgi:NAD(P)-dependent dehydrogenase (short-subunit alcohol dehydrogenase family)